MIVFLTALREEREALRRGWGLKRAGSLRGLEYSTGQDCVHLCTGMGAERVISAQEFAMRCFRPKLMVLLGYSVGLRSELSVGDLVADDRSEPRLLELLKAEKPAPLLGHTANCGFLNTANQKSAFASENDKALIADMESLAFLENIRHRCPALVIRSVSDELGTDLPLDFARFVTELGFPDLAGITRTVLRNPSLIPKLIKLSREASVATASLADFVKQKKSLLLNFGNEVSISC